MSSTPLLLAAPPAASSPSRLLVAGAGEGAKATVAFLPETLVRGDGKIDEVLVADPSEANLRAALVTATKRGLSASGTICHAEDAIVGGVLAPAPVIIQVDRLEPLAKILLAPEAASRPLLAFDLVLLPGGRLLGLHLAFDGEASTLRRDAAGLLALLSVYTRRGSREAIFGMATRVSHRLAEPLYRSWFADRVARNLPKFLAGLPPVSEPIEATFDGKTTLPVFPVFHDGDFWTSTALLEAALDTHPNAPPLDSDILVTEGIPDGVRLHIGRAKKTPTTRTATDPLRRWELPITIDRKNLIYVTD